MLSPFPDFKKVITLNRYKNKAIVFVITFIEKHETTKAYNSRIIKRRSSFSISSVFAINDFYIINPASMGYLLDPIYIKRPLSSYITLFFFF